MATDTSSEEGLSSESRDPLLNDLEKEEEEEEDDEEERGGSSRRLKINAHIKDRTIIIFCGDGNQKVKWLGHVAIAKWDTKHGRGWLELGIPIKITNEDNEEIDMGGYICELLNHNSHIFITTSR